MSTNEVGFDEDPFDGNNVDKEKKVTYLIFA